MKELKSNNYTKNKKESCDWTDEKIYPIHYRLFKFYASHGMIFDEVHEIISCK